MENTPQNNQELTLKKARTASRRNLLENEILEIGQGRVHRIKLLPTPDIFPLLCEHIDSIKAWYACQPRTIRNSGKYLAFSMDGFTWYIKQTVNIFKNNDIEYIDIFWGKANRKAYLFTVAVRCKELYAWEIAP